MNWLNRYVMEVKRYLPAAQREDLAAEIESLLREKAADREEELGRELRQEEEFALLREFGHPMRLAAAYGTPGTLIGETLYPLYVLSLRYLVFTLVAIYMVYLVWVNISTGELVLPGRNLGDWLEALFFWLVVLTTSFHYADRHLAKKDFFSGWDPASLPSAELPRESASSAIIASIFMVAWIALLFRIPGDLSFATMMGETGDRIAGFRIWLLLQVFLTLPVYLWLLFRPTWSAGKRLFIMLADLCVVIGAALMLQVDASAFAALYADRLPDMDIGKSSTLVLGLWMAGVGIDLLFQGRRLWQQWRTAEAREGLH